VLFALNSTQLPWVHHTFPVRRAGLFWALKSICTLLFSLWEWQCSVIWRWVELAKLFTRSYFRFCLDLNYTTARSCLLFLFLMYRITLHLTIVCVVLILLCDLCILVINLSVDSTSYCFYCFSFIAFSFYACNQPLCGKCLQQFTCVQIFVNSLPYCIQ
jgi:hypothetical protein